ECFGLAMSTREQNIHHPRPSSARKEALHCRSRDLCLGLSGSIRANQRPKPVEDDVHRIAHFGEFFFALHCPRHVELRVEGNEFESSLWPRTAMTKFMPYTPSFFHWRSRATSPIHLPGTSGQT